MTSGAPSFPSTAGSQVWLAFRVWLGGLIGFLIVAVVLAMLDQSSAGVLFIIWTSTHLGNILAWACDFVQTRRMMALLVLSGLSIVSMVGGLLARDEVEGLFAGSGAFPR